VHAHPFRSRELLFTVWTACTRKEEIARFSKAVNSPDFARMLKTRNLGPEHLEKQARLRKQVRVCVFVLCRFMRLTSCRTSMTGWRNWRATCKPPRRNWRGKSQEELALSESKILKSTWTPVLIATSRAPTLDTINRTYRNIDIAIARQMEDINKLSSRMSKLDLKSFQKSKPSSTRDRRLPDRSNKGGKAVNITSSIATAAATTLNSERSAYRLKKVLLSVRDKPLLNAKALTTSTRIEFATPHKLGNDLFDSTDETPMTPLPPPPATFPSTTTPSPLSASGGSRRTKHHAKSAWSSKKPEGESSPSPAPATFDWGPPPAGVSTHKPPSSLPFSLVPSTPPQGSNNNLPGLPFALR
jgi:nucleoporin NUP159